MKMLVTLIVLASLALSAYGSEPSIYQDEFDNDLNMDEYTDENDIYDQASPIIIDRKLENKQKKEIKKLKEELKPVKQDKKNNGSESSVFQDELDNDLNMDDYTNKNDTNNQASPTIINNKLENEQKEEIENLKEELKTMKQDKKSESSIFQDDNDLDIDEYTNKDNTNDQANPITINNQLENVQKEEIKESQTELDTSFEQEKNELRDTFNAKKTVARQSFSVCRELCQTKFRETTNKEKKRDCKKDCLSAKRDDVREALGDYKYDLKQAKEDIGQ